jgi:L1 cell adhesion molecule like protein
MYIVSIVTELASHFFRNIHNQIKQQVGKPIRDTVVSIPSGVSDFIKNRLLESAQAGGIRIKSFVEDTAATVLAYSIHELSSPALVLVVDVGWSHTQIALYSISGGTLIRLSYKASISVSGKVFVNLLAEHCAKEFQKKAKFSCSDNARAMLRLRRECEAAVKAMCTGKAMRS